MPTDTNTVKKPRCPSLTARRAQAIAFVANTLRPKSDARIGVGGLFGTDRESAALVRAFVDWADQTCAYRAHLVRRATMIARQFEHKGEKP